MDSTDIKSAVEGAFGPGAFELISGSGESARPGASAAELSLESIVAGIDSAFSNDEAPSDSKASAEVNLNNEGASRFVTFYMSGTLLAVPMENVLEIQRMPSTTPIPRTPRWLQGVTNLRGGVVSVVDLGLLVEIPSTTIDKERRLMVVQSLVDEICIGLIIDQVNGIRSFREDGISAPTAPVDGKLAPLLRGVMDQDNSLYAVVDIEKLLLSNELRQFDAA